MGMKKTKSGPAAKTELMQAPTNDDRRVRQAGENATRRAAERRDGGDTALVPTARRRGGLAEMLRSVIGG